MATRAGVRVEGLVGRCEVDWDTERMGEWASGLESGWARAGTAESECSGREGCSGEMGLKRSTHIGHDERCSKYFRHKICFSTSVPPTLKPVLTSLLCSVTSPKFGPRT